MRIQKDTVRRCSHFFPFVDNINQPLPFPHNSLPCLSQYIALSLSLSLSRSALPYAGTSAAAASICSCTYSINRSKRLFGPAGLGLRQLNLRSDQFSMYNGERTLYSGPKRNVT